MTNGNRKESLSNTPAVLSIVVNWNNPTDTIESLESLCCQEGIENQLLVVDNGSTDNSVTIIQQKFPQAEVIRSPVNLGFGRGANLGLKRALEYDAQYFFLMNNDAILAPDGLRKLLLYATDDTGILAPMIYYSSHPDKIWSIGGKTNSWTLEKSNIAVNTIDKRDWPPILEQDFVTGCGMLFPRRTLEVVGFFDERFPMYYEDMDLCQRVRQANQKIKVATQAKMWHKVAGSSGGSGSVNERYWMARSSIVYFRKHGRGLQWAVIVPYRLGSAIKTSLRLILTGKLRSTLAYWKGLRDGLAAFTPDP